MEGVRKNRREGSNITASILYYTHGHEAELQNKTNQKDLKMSGFTQFEAMLTALQVRVFSLVWDSTLVFCEWWLGGDWPWTEECCKQEVHGRGLGESLVSKSLVSNKGSFTKPRSLTSFTRWTHTCERLLVWHRLQIRRIRNNNNNDLFIAIFALFSIKKQIH